MTIDLYKYHTNPNELIYYDKAYECVPHLVWKKYREQHKELRKREDVLAKDPLTAYLYTSIVLKKDRFKKGEDVIAKCGWAACRYAQEVLNDRFKKGEEAIMNSMYVDQYKKFLKEKGIEI